MPPSTSVRSPSVDAAGPSIAVVGGGMLGLSLALDLAAGGARVVVYEAAAELGGLSVPQSLGEFTWDRFYHCILPSDRELIALLQRLGLESEIRWRHTHTGVVIDGQVLPLDRPLDLLRLPRISLAGKLRIGALTALAPRRPASPALDRVSAADWLRKWCGRSGYGGFWRHLLRTKLGAAAERVSARYIHATITRLASARSKLGAAERMGHVRGGYRRILSRLRQVLQEAGVTFRTGQPVTEVTGGSGSATVRTAGGADDFDGVALTVPNPAIARLLPAAAPELAEQLLASLYLGVLCTVVVAERPLTRNYLLNLCDDGHWITGVVEMTNLIDSATETAGRTLVYLPHYAPADDPVFAWPDEPVAERALSDLRRIFPDLEPGWARHVEVHRSRWIQPVPLTGSPPIAPPRQPLPGVSVFVVNSAQLPSCVLNNNDCVGLAARAAPGILIAASQPLKNGRASLRSARPEPLGRDA